MDKEDIMNYIVAHTKEVIRINESKEGCLMSITNKTVNEIYDQIYFEKNGDE